MLGYVTYCHHGYQRRRIIRLIIVTLLSLYFILLTIKCSIIRVYNHQVLVRISYVSMVTIGMYVWFIKKILVVRTYIISLWVINFKYHSRYIAYSVCTIVQEGIVQVLVRIQYQYKLYVLMIFITIATLNGSGSDMVGSLTKDTYVISLIRKNGIFWLLTDFGFYIIILC